MTALEIQQQINAIRAVTEKALESKETARQFLVDAGILKEAKEHKPAQTAKEKK